MIRTVPETTSEGIELYIRTYYSLLRSSGDVRIRSLEETHEGMKSSLHMKAEATEFDAGAFIYAALRLPGVMDRVKRVVMGQGEDVFMRAGMTETETWQRADAAARRRRMLFDGKDTLAAFVTSVSDIDDLIPMLTAYQIEWNKLHRALDSIQLGADLAAGRVKASEHATELQTALGINDEDMERLRQAWAKDWDARWQAVAAHEMDLRINLLASGFNDYRRAVESWWEDLVEAVGETDLTTRPVYFVSSNPHSLPNLLSGGAVARREPLEQYVLARDPEGLAAEWTRLADLADDGSRANLLYYVGRSYLAAHPEAQEAWTAMEQEAGIRRFVEPFALDISAQVIDLSRCNPAIFDSRILMPGVERLRESKALIVNVDYPLGFAAYHLLSQIATSTADLMGAYIMGKAATLNGRVGDVMIPNVVYDEHSRNTFLFKNCFTSQDVAEYLHFGTVFDNQKAVTVRGTFLQNRDFLGVFYREGYTDLEMEAGPYLSAVYEDIYPQRFPVNEIVNLFINAPYDIGLLHYASDTPYSRRQTLLSKSLSYFGVDATYACSVAILRRIIETELARLG